MERRLFVYGTLKASYQGAFGRAMRDRLLAESRPLGAAWLQGRLYDLGRYPGLVDSAAAGDIVHGELVELQSPVASFAWLDRYEGIRPEALDDSEYRRLERPVQLAGAGSDGPAADVRLAWVYLYARDLGRARLIDSGRWEG